MNSKDKSKPKRKRQSNFCYNFVKITGAIPVLLWLRPKVVYCGTDKRRKIRGGALVVSNHVAMTDPIAILYALWYRIPRFVATKELFDTKRKSRFFTRMRCIEVDKDNFNMSTFHAVSDELAAKKVVVVFPEGQINHETSALMPFKSGAILMAHKNNVPIIPVCIVKRQRKRDRQIILFGDPIDVRAHCGNVPTLETLNSLSDELRQIEEGLLQKYLDKKRRKKHDTI